MTQAHILPGSFRDPSGFVFRRDGVLYRQVGQIHRAQYDRLIDSGLYEALVEARLLLAHEEVARDLALSTDAYKVLRPTPIDFISYPYEWTFSQLRDAARVTLAAQRMALDHGMTLRDASAYNVQFQGPHPVLIDTTSFGMRAEGEPWVAYRQFTQHFLAPLALMALRDLRLGRMSMVHLDGLPLDLASSLLPFRARLKPGLLVHLFLHARSQRRHQGDSDGAAGRSRRTFNQRAFQGLIDSLEKTVARLSLRPTDRHWVDYYGRATHYSTEAMENKKALVTKLIDEVAPQSVWDLGSNTGLFGRIAAQRGIETVCLEMDAACVEESYRRARANGEVHVLPLIVDFDNPSPGIGWANEERMTLRERGPADLGLALALIHHLAIANNVPFGRIADFLCGLCRHLVVEFVPKEDEMVQHLLRTREDIFPDYTQDVFERAFKERFDVRAVEPIEGSDRILYLMRACSGA